MKIYLSYPTADFQVVALRVQAILSLAAHDVYVPAANPPHERNGNMPPADREALLATELYIRMLLDHTTEMCQQVELDFLRHRRPETSTLTVDLTENTLVHDTLQLIKSLSSLHMASIVSRTLGAVSKPIGEKEKK